MGTEFSKTSSMSLLEPKDGISGQSCDVAEDESGQSYLTGPAARFGTAEQRRRAP